MDQMQNVLLTMLQTVSAPKVEQQREPSGENSDSSFRKLLNDRTEQVSREENAQPAQPKEKVQTDSETEKDELDEVQLQELAAMQMFCAANVQTVTVPEQESQVNQALQGLNVPVEGADAEVVAQGAEKRDIQVPVEQNAQQEQEISTIEQKPVENVENTFQVQEQQESGVKTEAKAEVASKTEIKAEIKPEGKHADAPVKTMDTDTEASTVVEGEVENSVFRQVETAPVKVSETAAPTETAAPVETQVSEKVQQAVANGETRVEVQLTPEHLGKITIEVTQKGDGSLHIALHAENHQTRSLLERDISSLQTVLTRGTQQEVQVEVPRQQENQQNQFEDGRNQHSRQQQQEQKHQRQSSEDFLNQLRLGLVSFDEVQS